ncbi:MAG: GBS Bsp-like repeat-containing protein [Bacteroides fragilis]|nr:GBS Bsp-like repeat-containing protein [Bacteroides fragilis]
MKSKIRRMALTVLTVAIVTAATLWCISMRWMMQTWANLSMTELVYHLNTTLEGTNSDLIVDYCVKCIMPTVIVLFAIIILFRLLRKRSRAYHWLIGIGIVISLSCAAVVTGVVYNTLDIGTYLAGQSTYGSFIDENYVDPASVEITFPEEKRNLIYIFLESMEMTYADEESGGAFSENVIPELTELAFENETFSGAESTLNGGYSPTGTTWTIGGMFAQTSGLPLLISIDDNNMDTQDSFFSGATTLGDILEVAGYNQTLLIGSDATFGGRRLYFAEHGNYTIKDYIYAQENGLIDEDYYVWWGYEDEKLFEFAKEELLELAEEDEPFNLTMLTVDTHFEDGYVCDLCEDDYGDQYANVMACSSRQVSEFIEWIQQQDFYEDTTIVISGDHLTMDSDFCVNVDNEYERKVYTVYINADAETETNEARTYTTLDNFPTTLASLGVTIEGNRLGLGTNLFSDRQTLAEEVGYEEIENGFNQKSKLMEELGNIQDTLELKIRRYFDVGVGEYDEQMEILPITLMVSDECDLDIQYVMAAVWTTNDQSDIQWIEMEKTEDNNYYLNCDTSMFKKDSGEFTVDIYAYDQEGEYYLTGRAIVSCP